MINKIIRSLNIRCQIHLNRLLNFYKIHRKNKIQNTHKTDWLNSLNHLREFGYCKLPIYADLSIIKNDIKNNFNNYQNNEFFNILEALPQPDQYGVTSAEIDINSLLLTEKIFIKDLKNIIQDYYGNEFWLRNAPILRLDLKKYQKDESNDFQQRFFHLDYCERQLSLIIFLDDLNSEGTHTEYINKSNNFSWFLKSDKRTNKKFQKRVKKLISQFGITKLIGRSGEVYLFDAGNGLHRGFAGTDRSIIHLNFA